MCLECRYADCVIFYCYAECHYDERHYAERHYAQRRYAERRYGECRGAHDVVMTNKFLIEKFNVRTIKLFTALTCSKLERFSLSSQYSICWEGNSPLGLALALL